MIPVIDGEARRGGLDGQRYPRYSYTQEFREESQEDFINGIWRDALNTVVVPVE